MRLVKGAYWDHEIVEARQHGWSPPVFEVKADRDRNFEQLTRRLLDARPALRVAIASHNLRSVAHAIACDRAARRRRRDLELQVLRGLGDELQRGARRAKACACAPTARSATSSRAWPISCGGCWRTRATRVPRGAGRRHPARGAAGRAVSFAPFENEPLLELRRAPSRAGAADALAELDARAAARGAGAGSAASAPTGEALVSTDPGGRSASWRRGRAAPGR